MNIDNIKKEFPIFDEKIQNNDLVYLDSANSSQKPKIVLDRINDFYSKQFSNVGRSLHYLAVTATNLYENTRSSVQKYINAKYKNEIVFTKGATEALNLVANTLGQTIIEPNDEILITELEHHSNYVPWHFLSKLSKAVYQGKIFVNCKAQKTDGYQLSKAILLDETSEFNAKPELEIYADDVKCSHGSASGSLNENSIFYLMSRGLNYQQSKELLINGFLLDVVVKITDSEIKNLIKNMIGLKE